MNNAMGRTNKVVANKEVLLKTVSEEKVVRYMSEGNLYNISSVMEAIKTLIDVTFDNNEIVSFSLVDSDKELSIPCVTHEVIERTLSEKTPLSSVKINTLKEYVDGKPTGDHFEVFVTFFDCIVEFNIYGNTKAHSIELSEKFEEMLDLYTGYLKKIGLSNMYFLKEVTTKESFGNKDYAGVSLIYFMEIQKIKSIRTNTLLSVSSSVKSRIKKDNPKIDDILAELSETNTLL